MANTGSHGMCLSEVQMVLPLSPVGDRIHLLFPPALAVNNLGHVDIRVTHVVPHNLLPCAFAQPMAGMHGAEAPKIPFIARIGGGPLSVQTCFPNSAAKGFLFAYMALSTP